MRTFVVALTLMACNSGPITEPGGLVGGSASLCLHTDSAVSPVGDEQATVFDFAGKVVSDGPAGEQSFNKFDCFGRASRVLTVVDGDGATWKVGYGVSSEGVDITPVLAVDVDEDVRVRFVNTIVWGADSGVIVTRADESWVFAAQEGMATDMSSAPGAPLGSVKITAGDVYGATLSGECGRRRNVRVHIEADGDVDVEAGREQQIVVDGQTLTAVNPGSFEYIGDMNCSDVWGPTSWAVYDEG